MGELTSAQYSEWEAFDRLDPIGSWRSDYNFALLASVITNIAIGYSGAKDVELSKPLDFMPRWEEIDEGEAETQGQSVEQIKQKLMQIAASSNKNEVRNKLLKDREAKKLKEKGIHPRRVNSEKK